MTTTVQLPDDIERRLDALAQQTGLAKADCLRDWIVEHIEDVEDYFLAAQTLQRVRQGQEATFSAADIRKDLGLDH
jgi:RHH-type rel operon transcriptional repressor/antitoxin RelB